MYKAILKVCVAAAPLLLASACDIHPQKKLAPNFGNAVNQNAAVMTANPEGVDPATMEQDFDGPRTVGAIERYREGKVRQIERIQTTDDVQ